MRILVNNIERRCSHRKRKHGCDHGDSRHRAEESSKIWQMIVQRATMRQKMEMNCQSNADHANGKRAPRTKAAIHVSKTVSFNSSLKKSESCGKNAGFRSAFIAVK